jgi:hypothetical protein
MLLILSFEFKGSNLISNPNLKFHVSYFLCLCFHIPKFNFLGLVFCVLSFFVSRSWVFWFQIPGFFGFKFLCSFVSNSWVLLKFLSFEFLSLEFLSSFVSSS